MLGTLFDKVTGLFDKRFTLALLLPTFAFAAGVGSLVATLIGWHQTVTWWARLDAARQVALGVATAAGVVVLAIIIGTQVIAMTRLMEGYWPWTRPDQKLGKLKLGQLVRRGERERRKRLARDTSPLGYQRMYLYFPADPRDLMPTRLGNALRAAEAYPGDEERWGVDAPFWWPRLYLVLPDSARTVIDDARSGLDQLVVLSALSGVFGLVALGLSCASALGASWAGLNLIVGFACAAGGLLLSWSSYRAAATAATSFGELVRSCYDLYRGDLLAKLGWPMPDTLRQERKLWKALGQQFYRRGTDNALEPLINAPRKPPPGSPQQ